jgi:hypothetical protein
MFNRLEYEIIVRLNNEIAQSLDEMSYMKFRNIIIITILTEY